MGAGPFAPVKHRQGHGAIRSARGLAPKEQRLRQRGGGRLLRRWRQVACRISRHGSPRCLAQDGAKACPIRSASERCALRRSRAPIAAGDWRLFSFGSYRKSGTCSKYELRFAFEARRSPEVRRVSFPWRCGWGNYGGLQPFNVDDTSRRSRVSPQGRRMPSESGKGDG